MKLLINKFLILSLLIGLAACSAGGSDAPNTGVNTNGGTAENTPTTIAGVLQSLVASGDIPDLDRSDDLKGPDANNNGIRDDIEAWILAKKLPAAQEAAAKQAAKANQSAVLVNTADSIVLNGVVLAESRAVRCMTDKLGVANGQALGLEIEKFTANTKFRFLAYMNYAKALNGFVLSEPTGEACD